ncbi:PREDICTED: uncharacterized protein LOC105449757 [Wasmannia auropunctata]|uniref:uncharacterized protein LOC105449757 n=1 Tax=Wasmannia auropunctata TaxID=64793 RepID=UPI0005F00144|nr:PREDICTED: uncharacterized protein LOC105449757 [Wasmannia auropunctata]
MDIQTYPFGDILIVSTNVYPMDSLISCAVWAYTGRHRSRLLGASSFWDILGSKQIKSSKRAPILQETSLGWIISGNVQANYTQQQFKTHCGVSTVAGIQKQLEKFWQIEEHFVNTHSRNAEGRFIVQLPTKEGIQELGNYNSYNIAEKRLKALERKLEKQHDIKRQYHEFLHKYHNLKHMSEISTDKIKDKFAYYIPHHAVTKEDSITTKLRVVFDASCKTTSGRSLNEFLKVGPNLQEDLFDIVMRLRQHKHSKEDPVRAFELNTITYGMSSSSFMAIRCLQEATHQYKEQYPRAYEVILKDFYVDDLLTGADSIEELKELKRNIVDILSCAKFELNKWKSNTTEIEDLDSSEATVKLGEATKILGLWWNTITDTFHYRIKLKNDKEKVTKRSILSKVAEIYDPLSWIGPIVVKAKIILQRIWQINKDWDENITGETYTMWTQWREQIKLLENIVIPRKVLCDNPITTEIHGFCDASEAAYGACIYLRSLNAEGKYTMKLLCAKSRIAPIK